MPSRTTLSGVKVVIDLGSRDYYGLRDDIMAMIPTVTPLWTDLHATDPGIVALEMVCAVGDNIQLYADRNANECYLHTATQRGSVLRFAELAQYTPRQNTSALVDVRTTVSGAGLISAGFGVGTSSVQGQDQVRFELRTDYSPAGAGTYTLEYIEGTSFTEIFGSSDGTAGQSYMLSARPVAFNPDGTSSLQVWVKEGAAPFVQWTEVTSWADSSATDTHYIVTIDEDDVVTVHFGDDVNGKIPTSGTDNLKAIGREGGGVYGNQVGTDLITEILDTPGIVTAVTNATVPQGGEDKETIEEMKEAIPRHNRSNDRCVTEDDYAYHAEQVSGVASAHAVRGDEVGGSVYEMYVYVRAAGQDPSPAGTWDSRLETGTGLIGQVGAYVNERREGPVRVFIETPYLVRAFLTGTIYIFDTYFQSDVQELVERALSACFNGYEVNSDGELLGIEDDLPVDLPQGFPRKMGDDIKKSWLQHMLESISGVDYVDLTRMQRDPYARKLYDFSSDATFSQITVNSDTLRETWTLLFDTPTTFTVTGSLSGVQTATGTVGVAYTSDNGDLGFTMTAGSTPNFKENRYEIKTGPWLGNLEAGGYELFTNWEGTDTVYAQWDLTYSGGIS